MCDAIGTHSQAMGGWKWVPTNFIEATAKLLLCLGHQWITAGKLASARTPQVGSRAHHASTPYQRDIYWVWCTIKACKASCHQPCRSPKAAESPHNTATTLSCTMHSSKLQPLSVSMGTATPVCKLRNMPEERHAPHTHHLQLMDCEKRLPPA
jgi:hypothetical protein